MDDFVEVAFAQAEESCAIYLAVAADPVMQRRTETSAVGVDPPLLGLIFSVYEYGLRVPVRFFARKVIAALKNEYTFARWREPLRERRAAGSASNYDQIIMHNKWCSGGAEALRRTNSGRALLLHSELKLLATLGIHPEPVLLRNLFSG